MSGRNDKLMRRYARALGFPYEVVREAYRKSPDRESDRAHMIRVIGESFPPKGRLETPEEKAVAAVNAGLSK